MPLILRGVYYTLVSFLEFRIQNSEFRSQEHPTASVREERLTANRRHILPLRENYWLLVPGSFVWTRRFVERSNSQPAAIFNELFRNNLATNSL